MKYVNLSIDGKTVRCSYLKQGTKLWAHFGGKTFLYDSSAQFSKASGDGGELGPVGAPMPGKITKIFVQNGDTVKPEQTLLVMEAMKMEYTIKAGQAAVVENLSVSVGDQVTEGSLLLDLQEVANEED